MILKFFNVIYSIILRNHHDISILKRQVLKEVLFNAIKHYFELIRFFKVLIKLRVFKLIESYSFIKGFNKKPMPRKIINKMD